MKKQSHDNNFKNLLLDFPTFGLSYFWTFLLLDFPIFGLSYFWAFLLLDFPKETLYLLFPQAEETFGRIHKIDFLRQEPKKHKLSDSSLALDMPILFSFEHQQLLLWLVEFQEDKAKFSIYKLLRYTTVGRKNIRIEIALKMLQKDFELDTICELTGI